MDANRFDRLSRALAGRVNRRQAVRTLAAGGLASVALSNHQAGQSPASAQTDGETCLLDIVASVRIGPNATSDLGNTTPGEIRGQLRFDPEHFSDAVLVLEDGTELDASGQATGQAMTLRVALPPNGTLILVGAAERSLRSCEGPADGLLTGPAPGDLGDWHATFITNGSNGSDSDQQGEPTSSAGSGDSSGSNSEPSPTPSSSAGTCLANGQPCPISADFIYDQAACCSGVCDLGVCSSCRSDAQGPCSGPDDCCSGLCVAGVCGCGAQGQPCQSNSECCSGLCNGVCSFLRWQGESCTVDSNCDPRWKCIDGICGGAPPSEAPDPGPTCANTGESCAALECCAGNYCNQDAICRCDGAGQVCTSGSFCCSFICQNGFCL